MFREADSGHMLAASDYPDNSTMVAMIVIAVIAFFVGYFLRVTSIAVILAPAVFLTAGVIWSVKATAGITPRVRHGLTMGLVQPLAIIVLVCVCVSLIEVICRLLYYTDETASFADYSKSVYIVLLVTSIGATSLAAFALIIVLASR